MSNGKPTLRFFHNSPIHLEANDQVYFTVPAYEFFRILRGGSVVWQAEGLGDPSETTMIIFRGSEVEQRPPRPQPQGEQRPTDRASRPEAVSLEEEEIT